MSKVGFIAGSRPEVIKLAPVFLELRKEADCEVAFCLTGQHGENADSLAKSFGIIANRDFEVQHNETQLTHSAGRILRNMGSWIRQELPDLVVTQGDTSSTFAGSLAAFLSNVPVAHVEAGLRTFDLSRPFPEEGFRSMIGQIASLHFSPTSAARENLEREGVDSSKVFVVGNTVVDAMESMLFTTDFSDFEQPFILATAHRRENWSSEISALIESLKLVLSSRANLRLIWVAHPNPKLRELVELQLRDVPNANVVAPLPYGPFLSLLARANLVITDSGGIQEEAVSLGIPTLIARRSTERNEGIASGRAQLLFADQRDRQKQIIDLIDSPPSFHGMRSTIYGDGSASGRITNVILDFLTKTK